MARAVYPRVLDRVERIGYDVLGARGAPAPVGAAAARRSGAAPMTRRATLRGAERTPLDGARADVLVCGASFAGLAVARELAGAGADVLVVDRYEIGERATSACAAPTPWLQAMGVAARDPPGAPVHDASTRRTARVRYRLPWSWSAFDYRELCEVLWAQCGDARFEIAKVERARRATTVAHRPRRRSRAPLIVDALGWRRVLGPAATYQPPEAPISRGLEVHPHDGGGDDLDVWIDRSLVRRGYGWRVPAGGEQRVGVGSYEPRHHVKEPTDATRRARSTPTPSATRATGSRTGCAPPPRTACSSSATAPGTASRSRARASAPRSTSASPRARAARACWRASADARARRWRAYARLPRRATRRAFRRALRLQRLIPALPPRVLTAALRAHRPRSARRRAFGWYLDQAHPSSRFAAHQVPA